MPDPRRAIRARVGRAIRRYRRARGFSQERLAELAASSGKHVGAIERGQANVGLDMLGRLAAALSVDIVVLFDQPPVRRRGDELKEISNADVDALEAIARRVKGAPARRRPRARD